MFREEWNSWKRMPRLICLRSMNRFHRALVRLRQMRQNLQAPARSVEDFPHAPPVVDQLESAVHQWTNRTGQDPNGRAVFYLKLTVVSHRDQLRDCDFSKGIIFDDFDVSHWPPTASDPLLDWDEPRGLDVKHGHVVIPPHTRKIFTHNRGIR